METQKSQNPSPAMNAAMSSCPKKKTEGASFIQDLRDHLDEFVHASMDEHNTCFKKTIPKMFGMAKMLKRGQRQLEKLKALYLLRQLCPRD